MFDPKGTPFEKFPVGCKVIWTYQGANGILNLSKGMTGTIEQYHDSSRDNRVAITINWNEGDFNKFPTHFRYCYSPGMFELYEEPKKETKGFVRGDAGMFGNKFHDVWDYLAKKERGEL